MVLKFCVVFVCIVSIQWCYCQRRIIHGKISETGRRFMVYLLNSKYSDVQPVGWLCGGSLISETQILTSAACLTEVKFMYAIAGYRKYVSTENIDNDECTREKKQKVVQTIIPAEFKNSQSPEDWMKYDIGIAVVERPYNFSDISYFVLCSYPPAKTYINYDKKLEDPGTTASIFGWGGTRGRNPNDKTDLNSEYIHEAKTVITNTSFCAHYLSDEMKPVLYNSLLCAYGSGYVARSQVEPNAEPSFDDCFLRRFNLNEPNNDQCKDYFDQDREKLQDNSSEMGNRRRNVDSNSDGGGICENDHGGPLVTYFGSSEIIVGISITSIYTSRYECEGPYLYFAVAKMGALMRCLMAENNETLILCKQLTYNAKKVSIEWPKAATPWTTKPTTTTSKPTVRTTHTWIPKWTRKNQRGMTTRRTTRYMPWNRKPIQMRVTVQQIKTLKPNAVILRPIKDIALSNEPIVI